MVVGASTVLNLVPSGVMPVVTINQTDNGYDKEFLIYNGSSPYYVPSDVSATIRGTKSDGYGVAESVTVTSGSNVVTVTISEQMTAAAGKNIYELVFVDTNDLRVGTINFVLWVEKSALDDDTVVSDSDIAYAEEVLTGLQSVAAYKSALDNKPYEYDTVALMLVDTALEDGMFAITGGYSAINDGGGAIYRISSTAPTSAEYETLNSGLYAEKIYNLEPSEFQAERIFRKVSYKDDDGYSSLSGQGMTNTGSTFLLGGRSISDDSAQIITEYELDGTYVREASFTSSDLGHMNSFAYNSSDGMIYSTGASGSVVKIDYSDLSISEVFSTGLTSVLGVDCWNGSVYIYGYETAGTYLIGTLDTSDGTFTQLCSFTPPTNTISFVTQGMAVKDGFAYICFNQTNKILKVRISTGNVDRIYELGDGNGFFPYGELENATFVDDQLYIVTAVWSSNTSSSTTSGGYYQVFKTNIGGVAYQRGFGGQGLFKSSTLYVNKNNTSNNPIGSSSNAFESLLEVSAFVNYNQGKNGAIYTIITPSGQTFDNEYLELNGVSANVRMYNCTCAGIYALNGNYFFRQIRPDELTIEVATVQIQVSTIATLTAYGSVLYFGASNTITTYALERSNICPYYGADLENIYSGSTACSVFGSQYYAFTGLELSLDSTSVVNDPFGLPTTSKRVGYVYHTTNGEIGILYKFIDGTVRPSTTITLASSSSIALIAPCVM